MFSIQEQMASYEYENLIGRQNISCTGNREPHPNVLWWNSKPFMNLCTFENSTLKESMTSFGN